MGKTEFSDWIDQRLDALGMTQKQLAAALNTSESHVSLVLAGKRALTADFVLSVAVPLDADPVAVLRVAGILPPGAGETTDPALAEAWALLSRLADKRPEALGVVLEMLRGVAG
jgi:transcriptional regulator with XRE-family HTH domain